MFSIVVPIYNTEKFLQKCIDSLVGQTFKDIEIILVNDCSPDNCSQIIEENMKRDSRIKLVKHEQNKGLIQARITGFNASSYDYILNVDSDDYLATDCCEKLYNILSKKHYDVVQFQGIMLSSKKGSNKSPDKKYYDFDTTFEHREYFDEKVFEEIEVHAKIDLSYIWSKCLYKPVVKKCFEHIGETQVYWHEDTLQSFIIFYYAKSIIYVDDVVYYYCLHDNNSFKNVDVERYWNGYFPNFLRVNYLLQSFIKKEGIDKKYPELHTPELLNRLCKNFTEEVVIGNYNSHQHNLFAMYKNDERIILYIFFIKITIKRKKKK